mgnify:CR=1 FL=1
MTSSKYRFHHTLRVRWSECDAQKIAYNAAYLTWSDVAQVEYFRNLGLPIYQMASLNLFDTVTAKVTIEYKIPAKLDDQIDIYVRIVSIGTSSIKMEFELCRHRTSQVLATIFSIYAHYDNKESKSSPVPQEFREIFRQYEETGDLPSEEFIWKLTQSNSSLC